MLRTTRFLPPLLLAIGLSIPPASGEEPGARPEDARVPPPDHVVILLCDTLRWDHVGASGTGNASTPNIDSLVREGIYFRNAHTVFPGSAPSYASLFSSLLPFEHGLTNNALSLPPDLAYLPEAADNWGFHTAGFVSNYYCGESYGFQRGYDTFQGVDKVGKHSWTLARKLLPWLEAWNPDEDPLFLFVAYMDLHVPYSLPHNPRWLRVRLDGKVIRESVSPELNDTQTLRLTVPPGNHRLVLERTVPPLNPGWNPRYRLTPYGWSSLLKSGVTFEFTGNVRDRKADPRAETVSWMSDGFPVSAVLNNPTGADVTGDLVLRFSRVYSVEETRTIYPQSVEVLDREIGRVIGKLRDKGILDRTLLVLVSDHGEGLGDHGLKGHIEHLYDSLMRVPLILRYPPLGKGVVVDDIASIIDVAPTLGDLLGRSWPTKYGQSLLPLLREGGPAGRKWAFAETYPPEANWRATCLRTPTHKLIVNHSRNRLEFYDLAADPSEAKDLSGKSPAAVRRAVDAYCDLFDLEDPFRELSSAEELDLDALSPEEIRKLKALGYLE